MNSIILKETTVTVINNTRIGCGNIGIDEYLLPDSSKKEDLTAELFFTKDEYKITVVKGSRLEINGKSYIVEKIALKAKGKPYGLVYLKEL